MVDHGARAHATWSASSTAANWHCAGRLAISADAPQQKESIHAARGTACHQVAEKCIRNGFDAVDLLHRMEATKEHNIEVDEEIVASAQVYVDYVRDRWKHAASLQIEQKFSLSSLNPPFDAGGTADAVLDYGAAKVLEVVDLKHGMGVVDVKENPQLRTYALGAMLANPGLNVDHVKVTIVQPRAPHKEGRIRSETFHVADLAEWTSDLMAAMKRSKQAAIEYEVAKCNSVLFDEWAQKWLTPGKCKWCPVEATCPKVKKRAYDVAGVWFDDRDQAQIANKPGAMSPDELAKTLDALDTVEDWIKAVRAYAHTLAETGVEIPNYQLSDKVGLREWAAEEDKVKADLIAIAGLTEDDLYERKLRSVAQVEKVLGAKRKDLIKSMWHQPVTGKNLVRHDKTTRPPAKSKAETYFENQN